MKASVTKDKVSIIEKDIVHAGEYNINHIEFEFSAEYTADLVKNAVFSIKDNVYQTSIINDQCDIPAEILSDFGEAVFGVYAYKVNDDQLELRYSPFPARFTIISGSYDPTAEESEEITPSQFEQYMQALNDGLNKVEESIKKMDEATSSATQLVDDINQKLENGDFIGPQGPEGPQGAPGNDGTNGQDGVGITTITSGQSTVEEDKTVTPVTVQKTDGSSQIFNVEAKNGLDGQNGKDGKDGVNGQPGRDGADGKDATINGQNTVEITTDNNITLDQQESVLKLGLNSQLIPKQNAEGTDNTFDDGLESPLYDLGGDGKSEQVVTTGKNLLPNNITSQIINGVTVTKNDDGSITLNGTATSYFTLKFTDDPIILQPGTYMQSFHPSGSATPASGIFINSKDSDSTQIFDYSIANTISKTLDVETTIVNYNVAVNPGTVIKNITLSPMLEPGPQATEYEPYTGGQPSPSSDYKQPINSIEGSVEFIDYGGINICSTNFADWESGEYNTSGDKANNDFRLRLKNLIYCRSNTDFYFNLNNTTGESYNFLVRGYDNNKSFVKNYGIVGTGSITVDKGTAYLSITIGDVDGTTTYDDYMTAFNNNKLQPFVCFGGIENKTYEPYIEPNQVTFNLNDEKLRSVGDVKDELVVDLETGDYYKVENVGEVVFDGSDDEEWANIPDGTGRERYTSPKIQNLVYVGTKLCQSNYFKSDTSEEYYEDGTIKVAPSGGVSIYDDLFTSMDNFKQWLSTHNTIVDYILKTPTTKKLGTLSAENLAKLKTFKGYNNVTVNTNLGLMNIRFTYGLDIKKYVDNKLAEISTAIIEEG